MIIKDSAYNPFYAISVYWPEDPLQLTMDHIDKAILHLEAGGIKLENEAELDIVLTMINEYMEKYRNGN